MATIKEAYQKVEDSLQELYNAILQSVTEQGGLIDLRHNSDDMDFCYVLQVHDDNYTDEMCCIGLRNNAGNLELNTVDIENRYDKHDDEWFNDSSNWYPLNSWEFSFAATLIGLAEIIN